MVWCDYPGETKVAHRRQKYNESLFHHDRMDLSSNYVYLKYEVTADTQCPVLHFDDWKVQDLGIV